MSEGWEAKAKIILSSLFTFAPDEDKAPVTYHGAIELSVEFLRLFKALEHISRGDITQMDDVTRTILNLAVLFDANPLYAENKAFLQPILWCSIESYLDGMAMMKDHMTEPKPEGEQAVKRFLERDRAWFGAVSAYIQLVQAVAYISGGYGFSRLIGPHIREMLLPLLFWGDMPDAADEQRRAG